MKDITLAHLQIAQQHLDPEQVARFKEQLALYLERPDDVTGLRLDNLCLAAANLQSTFETMTNLLKSRAAQGSLDEGRKE